MKKIIWNEFVLLLNNIQLFLMENYFIYRVQPNKPTKQCNLSFSYLALTDPLLLGFHKPVELSSLSCILFWKIVHINKFESSLLLVERLVEKHQSDGNADSYLSGFTSPLIIISEIPLHYGWDWSLSYKNYPWCHQSW